MLLIFLFTEESHIDITGWNQQFSDKSPGMKSLRSHSFQEGTSMEACNIHCSLKPDPPADKPGSITVVINELAPFGSSEDYCLFVNDDQTPTQCSGSKQFQIRHGPYQSRNGWEFRLTLNNSAEYVPEIRFWVSFSSKYCIKYYFLIRI